MTSEREIVERYHRAWTTGRIDYRPQTAATATAVAAECFTVRAGLIVQNVLVFDRLPYAPPAPPAPPGPPTA